MIVEAGPSANLGRPAGKLVLQFESKAAWRQNPHFPGGQFFLLVPSVGLIGPTHVMEGDTQLLKSIDLNVNLI